MVKDEPPCTGPCDNETCPSVCYGVDDDILCTCEQVRVGLVPLIDF